MHECTQLVREVVNGNRNTEIRGYRLSLDTQAGTAQLVHTSTALTGKWIEGREFSQLVEAAEELREDTDNGISLKEAVLYLLG